MKNHDMVIYQELNIVIERKIKHQQRRYRYKRNKHRGIGWCLDNGDIPTAVIKNDVINLTVYPVENHRGLAYAHRNAKRYRKTKNQLLEKSTRLSCYRDV